LPNMTNDELREKLWEVEKDLAESKRVVESLIRERKESQMVVSAIMPFVPEIREKMMGSTLQQYKEQLERIVKRINELPSA
jgi:hypothetical protein